MDEMFRGARFFDGQVNTWDVSSVTSMVNMFRSAETFNQDISTWDISSVNDLSGFMIGKTSSDYSTTNYDALLNAWSLLAVQSGVNADFGEIQYTGDGEVARNVLTGSPNNWTINDGGRA
jgi:surface protein